MRNRIRINGITSWRVEDIARREGRLFHDALAILIADGYRERAGMTPSAPDAVDDLTDGAAAIGKTVSFHAKQSTIEALRRMADADERSLSNLINTILRTELRRTGFLKARGNDPVLPTKH